MNAAKLKFFGVIALVALVAVAIASRIPSVGDVVLNRSSSAK